MRRRSMPEIREGGVNVTPLIDVVMCLIIFFMLVARIGIDTGADETIQIPQSVRGIDIQDMGNTLLLNVRPAGGKDLPQVTALLGGKLTELALKTEGGASPLVDTLKHFQKQNPNIKVIIRGDQDMDYKHLEPVLLACAEARVTDVNFNTRKTQ